ncbi:MAG: CDP-alcohol phosphatidyltransferase family protein [Candidatus Lindowbacteria bacterium]|nr:CDP-alcohol phosphatidyltransferase family protein [Candidatus Lindowbacteria bacterium]
MTISNRLTISRAIAAIVFIPVFRVDDPLARCFALLLFTLAAISDYYDGKFARDSNQTTRFGVMADPIADKLLVGVCLVSISLLRPELIPMWMTVIILIREVVITIYRFSALAKGRALAAERLGKWKTGLQLGVIPCALIVITIFTGEEGQAWERLMTGHGIAQYMIGFVWWLALLTTFLTVYSGATFLKNNMTSNN